MVKQAILVAEDDEDDAFIMQRALKETGLPFEMQHVQTGDEAVDYLIGTGVYADREKFPLPVLVFLDLKMPGRSGFDVLEWKRGRPELKMPFVVLSSSPEERDMRRARELRAGCYLIKPPTKSMLIYCFNQFGVIE